MKRNYQQPSVCITPIHASTVLAVSGMKSIQSGDAGITYGGGGNGPARTRRKDIWEDEWSE